MRNLFVGWAIRRVRTEHGLFLIIRVAITLPLIIYKVAYRKLLTDWALRRNLFDSRVDIAEVGGIDRRRPTQCPETFGRLMGHKSIETIDGCDLETPLEYLTTVPRVFANCTVLDWSYSVPFAVHTYKVLVTSKCVPLKIYFLQSLFNICFTILRVIRPLVSSLVSDLSDCGSPFSLGVN